MSQKPVATLKRWSASEPQLLKNLGMVLLAVWLILFGILVAPFLKFSST